MVLTQNANRLLLADYHPNGVLQLVAIHPHVDPTKIHVSTINLNREDQRKLWEMMTKYKEAQENICPGTGTTNPHQFVYRADSSACSICGREKS